MTSYSSETTFTNVTLHYNATTGLVTSTQERTPEMTVATLIDWRSVTLNTVWRLILRDVNSEGTVMGTEQFSTVAVFKGFSPSNRAIFANNKFKLYLRTQLRSTTDGAPRMRLAPDLIEAYQLSDYRTEPDLAGTPYGNGEAPLSTREVRAPHSAKEILGNPYSHLITANDAVVTAGGYVCEWSVLQKELGLPLPSLYLAHSADVVMGNTNRPRMPYQIFCWEHFSEVLAMTETSKVTVTSEDSPELEQFLATYERELDIDMQAQLNRTEREVASARAAWEKTQQNLEAYQRKLEEKQAALDTAKRQAEGGVAAQKEQLAQHMKTVLRMPQVASIQTLGAFSNGLGFTLETTRIDSPRLTDGTIRDFGRFTVHVEPRRQRISIMRIKEPGGWPGPGSHYQHPHVDETGLPCWGNLSSDVTAALASGELAVAVSLVIMYLESVYEYEHWGRKVYSWPLSPNSPEGFKPRSRLGCTRCARSATQCECCTACGGIPSDRYTELKTDELGIFHDSAGEPLFAGVECKCRPCPICGVTEAERSGNHTAGAGCLRCDYCGETRLGVPAKEDKLRAEQIVTWAQHKPEDRPCPHYIWCQPCNRLVSAAIVRIGDCAHMSRSRTQTGVVYPKEYGPRDDGGVMTNATAEDAIHERLMADALAAPAHQAPVGEHFYTEGTHLTGYCLHPECLANRTGIAPPEDTDEEGDEGENTTETEEVGEDEPDCDCDICLGHNRTDDDDEEE